MCFLFDLYTGDTRVNFMLVGLVVGFSFVIIVLSVVVTCLCWKMKKMQKEAKAAADKPPSLGGQNEITTKGRLCLTFIKR